MGDGMHSEGGSARSGDGQSRHPAGFVYTRLSHNNPVIPVICDLHATLTAKLGLAQITGISHATVKREIAALRKSGKLKRVGPDKTGHWEVIE